MTVTVSVSSLQYVPVGPKGREWAAQIQCAQGQTTLINLRNAVQINDRAVNLQYAVVDNIGNAGLVTVQLGNISFSVPPFTRETYSLPEELTNLQITPATGSVTVTVSEGKLVSDQTNSLAVQQTAAATLTYQFITYSANQNQLTTDVNKSTLFVPTAANMTYTLMLGSSAGNGWLQFLHNEGTKNVVISPTAPNTINGVAGSFTLFPGQSAILSSDGNNWHIGEREYSAVGLVAFITFNGASGTIRNSGGVSSVVRSGLGDYTVNFVNNMPDTNYTVLLTCSYSTAAANYPYPIEFSRAVGSVRLFTIIPGPSGVDADVINVMVYR